MIQLTGWVGTILFIIGCTALANKSIFGFWCNGLANISYAIQSIIMSNTPLLVLSILLAFINAYGIYNWNKKYSKGWKITYLKDYE